MSKIVQIVAFTDGRTVEKIAFDARGDDEFSAAVLVARMKENGWYPVKGSEKTVVVENGVTRPFIARVKRSRIWKMA
jgi:hypothetical protein